MPIGTISYALSGLAFMVLALLVFFSETRAHHKWLLFAAALSSTIWSAAMALALQGVIPAWPGLLLEILRDVSWILFLASVLRVQSGGRTLALRRILQIGVAVLIGLALATGQLQGVTGGVFSAGKLRFLMVLGNLSLAIVCLLLLENIFRNAGEDARWAIKFLCFGLGGVFVYDIFQYADALLLQRVDGELFAARGFVNALTVPLIAVSAARSKSWTIGIHVSRQVVFHSATFIASGLYLLLIAGIGYYLREVGGNWGPTFQIIALSGALLMLLVVFSSGSVRANLRRFITANFFQYKYDYRQSWLNFIQTLSSDDRAVGLHARILHAIADLVDSPAAVLLVYRPEDHAFFATANWNFPPRIPALAASHPLATHFETREEPLIIGEEGTDGALPEWIAENERAWLILPLRHRDRLQALLVLGKSRALRRLDWEDIDLLKTVCRQAASYLAEEMATRALDDARQMEAFNRRFAFVVHDVKNLVGQLSLMLKNAEKHKDNPEFQKDMLATVANSVAKMKGLLEQLHAERDKGAKAQPAPLADILRRIARNWHRQHSGIGISLPEEGCERAVDEKALTSVLDHLLQNAVEAASEHAAMARIMLRARRQGNEIVIEVEDNGPGMDDDFIQNQLFRPLDTTKKGGYGIGAYQVRETVRAMGGRLEVQSVPGEGTIMRIVLPCADEDDGVARVSVGSEA